MIKKNEEYIVNIIDNGSNGEGICKIDEFTIFVSGAIKEEKCKIKILKVNKSFAYAKVLDIIEKSNYRVEPDCISYKKCGGCNLRHINYEYTLKMKREKIQNLVNKTLSKRIVVDSTIGMDKPYFYRNKAIYPVAEIGEKRIVGIYANRSHSVIEFDKCMIQSEESQEIAKYILDKWNNSIYNEETHKGFLRNIMIRVGTISKEIMVVLVTNGMIDYDYSNLIKNFPNIKTIIINDNHEVTNVVLSNNNKVIYGDGVIYDYLNEYKFQISPNSFFQVNSTQTIKMYNEAIKMADLKPTDVIYDLYCGIGTISIFASKYVKRVYGIEIVHSSIENARLNARLNNILNVDFIEGDVETAFENAVKGDRRADVVIVDPPRKGLDIKTIETLLDISPRKIVYVSCNPATLIRDLKEFEDDYDIKKIQPIDNFPYTNHCESVCVLERK